MALFMPTNITPDARGSLGNGTVDATQPLTVSWQVNGNSAMTAYQISVYTYDESSTLMYTTGKITTGCPFYGKDYNGNPQMFSYTMPPIPSDVNNVQFQSNTITNVSVNYDTFKSKAGANIAAIAFVYQQYTGWRIENKSGNYTLSQYGITVTGTPRAGDIILVTIGTISSTGGVVSVPIETAGNMGTLFVDWNTFMSKTGNLYGTYTFRIHGAGTGSSANLQVIMTDPNGNKTYLNDNYGSANSLENYGIGSSGLSYNSALNGDTFTFYTSETNGFSNGYSYKLSITQWWGTANDDQVSQVAYSAFVTRALPSISINNVPGTLGTREYTFTASYSQAQGDALNWVRWLVAVEGQGDTPILDTGNIYGTADLQVSYDGFFSGTTYGVQCMIQTQNGVSATTGWKMFSVSYSSTPLSSSANATGCTGRNAVLVSWPSVLYIPGSASGSYSTSGNTATLASGSSITWSTANNVAMSFAPTWSIAYSGKAKSGDANLLSVGTSRGNISLVYTEEQQTLSLSIGRTLVATETNVSSTAQINLVLNGSAAFLYVLNPGNTSPVQRNRFSVSYTQGSIQSVVIGGPQTCNYVSILAREMTTSEINEVMNNVYTPAFLYDSYLFTNFTNGLNAGNVNSYLGALSGTAVYRLKEGENNLVHLCDVGTGINSLYDYGAASQESYMYYLYPLGTNTYITSAIISNQITPCFWDWSVLDCSLRSDGTYQVNAEYRFGKNLNSGTITNNNKPGVYENFTRYPTIMLSVVNYKSGTLKSLIGVIDYANGNTYSDTKAMRDAIFDLSTSPNPMFLKSRKGDVMQIRPDGNTSLRIKDETPQQAQEMTFSWSEINEGGNLPIFVTPNDSLWTENTSG